ncbi:hypothetical protein [Rhizobium sp. L1K21]|uniref:hypothetical protein n=1 Tax=Rhizobium sp. L1K21 TaxID=2954933 RepID=UPI00209368BF|nr:hypothetical protein [Rhizobium sp. L1K21]MCO6187662.1 hypothetical protein [Rhizobium sp. L1K21]
MENNSFFLGVVIILNAAVFVIFLLLLTGFFGFEAANASEIGDPRSAIEKASTARLEQAL